MNHNKPPLQQGKTPLRSVPSPFQTRCIVDELSGDKGEHFGAESMVRTPTNGRIRPGLSVANGSPDLGSERTPASNAGSEYDSAEFTREDVEALLTEKMKVKSKYNYKDRFDNMLDYMRRLRLCIRWFQELEGNYAFEQEQLRNALEVNERRYEEMELMLKKKEEELNLIILELKKSLASFHDKIAEEESAKLTVMGTLAKEKEATIGVEKSNASFLEELRKIQGELDIANQRITSLNDMYNLLQEYKSSLQSCNSKIQSDLDSAQEAIKRGEKEKAEIVENLSTLKGQYQSLQEQLTSSQASRSEAMKQKEALLNEVACLRIELQQMKDEYNSRQAQVQTLATEVDDYKDKIAKRSIELEAKCLSQENQISTLHDQLLVAERKLQFSNVSALEARAEFEAQKKLINELQNCLEEKESKVKEGEKLRKTLYNTILELKGNIRVFCRVRPQLLDDSSCNQEEFISYPTSMEASGRAIDLMQNDKMHSFTFDKVFMPNATQEEVYNEISQLVQSALDGSKVCIFAYGQTGSGKTYTMMGRPGELEEKGLIPRSLEQIFQTKQALQPQGWRYEMQVSALEIYNETIRDLLATKGDTLQTENCASAKQYAIKHDVKGNTHVSDLTIVDVRRTNDISYVLDQASKSRSVSKTQMSEESSRSHFVFTIRISVFNENTRQNTQGVLNLVDLAGSESLSRSGTTADRVKESQSSNKSLSSLADVIFALGKEDHVPFRNSKLTFLLQPCLGGDSKTLMFVNIAPEASSVGESLSSLRFAARVNACEIGAPRRQTSTRSSESRLSYG